MHQKLGSIGDACLSLYFFYYIIIQKNFNADNFLLSGYRRVTHIMTKHRNIIDFYNFCNGMVKVSCVAGTVRKPVRLAKLLAL